MEDIWIGDDKRGTTWIKCWEYGIGYISMNDISYWCSLKGCPFNLRICRDTVEGIKLKELMTEGNTQKVLDYLHECTIKHMTVVQFTAFLADTYDRGFENGKKHKLEQIREALDL